MANVPTTRRTEKQWTRLVAEWRRSGATAGEFARNRDIAEGTLRWWAWRLGRAARTTESGVSLLPIRVVAGEDDATVGEKTPAEPVWTLHTARGELRVYTDGSDVGAVVAALIGGAK